MPCLVCKKLGCNFFHIKPPREMGPDQPWNLVPLCNEHLLETKTKGIKEMFIRYSAIRFQIMAMGWKLNGLGNLDHDKLGKPPKTD
jgi:hypothetical protein